MLDELDRLKIADRTIIVFASDNGGNMYNEVEGESPTSNSPLRGGKATMYEGGVRGPATIVWPDVVKAKSRSDAVVQSIDFYPTLLEMLGIERHPDHAFDGIDLTPTLRGEKHDADRAIFTYFPHAPRVPDWLPPAVSVHRGDWKLIRLFHGGDDGANRWKLFNLKDDIGEKHDLATEMPERVKELDALIDDFLERSSAVVPARNIAFDPSKYNIEDEGKSRRKSSNQRQQPKKRRPKGPPVAGWSPGNDVKLSLKSDELVIVSTGNDPHLSHALPKPIPAGKLELLITLASQSKGRGQLFWREVGVKPAFFRDRSITFDITHDAQPHTYRISFEPANPITTLRLDPSQGPGTIRLVEMRLTNADGAVVDSWKLAK